MTACDTVKCFLFFLCVMFVVSMCVYIGVFIFDHNNRMIMHNFEVLLITSVIENNVI